MPIMTIALLFVLRWGCLRSGLLLCVACVRDVSTGMNVRVYI